MKILFLIIFFSVFTVGCNNFSTKAQIRASNRGKIVNVNQNTATTNIKTKAPDISRFDFKNFTFPDFSSVISEKTFTLINGASDQKDVFPKYRLRKTYYFDLTGDKKNEAVSHIIAEGCQMGCETSNLFYIHSEENKQLKLIWKIATGGNVLGGLKSVNFKANEIMFEVFGNCMVENQIIKPEVDLKKNPKLKTTNYTRFIFSGGETGFTQTAREVLPLATNIDFTEYRTQISFGQE